MRFIFSLLSLVGLTSAAIPSHEITSLPGWDQPLPSKQYSGYLSVNETAGRYLHYWFVESENSPADSPLVLWLNGGPGCSSLDGLLYEQGPLLFAPSSSSNSSSPTLVYNPYTWSKLANMLYLEAPAGVGFSYSNTKEDYTTDDVRTANDNYQFLLEFFKAYPEFNTTKGFFIAGESYAGIYVPTLADTIRINNENTQNPFIPLQGIAVGNGCSGSEVGICSNSGEGTATSVEYLYGHDLYSAQTYNSIKSQCTDYANPSQTCRSALKEMGTEINNVNIYNIYDDCINGGLLSEPRRPLSSMGPSYALASFFRNHGLGDVLRGPSECIDGIAAFNYLNTAETRTALHVQASTGDNDWHICTSNIRYTSNTPNLPRDVYPNLIKNYRVLIFNGDADACVPVTDNESWTSGMGIAVKSAWKAWLVDSQVAGYVTVYDQNEFTFLTVKGAGHMVPEYKPKQAFTMFQKFLNNQPF